MRHLIRGGFANLYHVKDSNNREYALKLLHDATNIQRLRQQLHVLKVLNTSELFLKTYQSKNLLGAFYILIEYVDGDDLQREIQKEVYTESQAIKVVLELLKALEFLHKNKFIHGDIKPENILQRDEKYFLIDYDVVKTSAEVKVTHIQSDDDFTAPEIYKGTQTLSSDIYSLGCSLYYILSAEHIYDFKESDDFSAKMFLHLYASAKKNEKISTKMMYLIERMTDKDFKNRATIQEIKNIINSDEEFVQDLKEEVIIPKSKLDRYENMAEDNISYAQNILGLIYEQGKEVKQDLNKALQLYIKASSQGLTKAEFNLALCYKYAKGCSKDYAKARELFKKAASKEHQRSLFYLADMYENALGVQKDMIKAYELYKESASYGFKPAIKRMKQDV